MCVQWRGEMLDSGGTFLCVLSWSLRRKSIDLRRTCATICPTRQTHAAILCPLEWARLCHVKACVFPSHEMSSHFL